MKYYLALYIFLSSCFVWAQTTAISQQEEYGLLSAYLEVVKSSVDSVNRRTAIDSFVSNTLKAYNVSNKKFFTSRMLRFAPEDFSSRSRHRIEKEIQKDSTLYGEILLVAGYINLTELKPRIRTIRSRVAQKQRFKKLHLAATLSLARMGDKDAEAAIISLYNQEADKFTKYTRLGDFLIYINSPNTIRMVIKGYMDEANYQDMPNEEPYRMKTFYYGDLMLWNLLAKVVFTKLENPLATDREVIIGELTSGNFRIDFTGKAPKILSL